MAAQENRQYRQIAGALDRRPGSNIDFRTHLVRNHMRQRGLSQTRRPIKQQVINRLPAPQSGLDNDLQILAHPFLPNNIFEILRTQGNTVALILATRSAHYPPVIGH